MKCILEHSFNNYIDCIIVIFRISQKYPIRKDKWNIWSNRIA